MDKTHKTLASLWVGASSTAVALALGFTLMTGAGGRTAQAGEAASCKGACGPNYECPSVGSCSCALTSKLKFKCMYDNFKAS